MAKRTHDWQVTLDFVTTPFDDDQIDVVMDALADAGGALGVGGNDDDSYGELSVTVTVEAMYAPLAFTRADDLVERAIRRAGIEARRTLAIEILDEEAVERRLAEPTIPPLVSTPEVAEILGVSRQRVHQLRSLDTFPFPVLELATGPVWARAAVESFAETSRQRRPGRPPRVLAAP